MTDSDRALEAENGLSLEMTTEIVAAYVSNNPVPANELPNLISSVWQSLKRLDGSFAPAASEKLVPAVPVKKSVTHDYIVCLEDGRKFKSLKRPLMARYGMTPDEYRAKWGLASDYPMVAPSYAEKRSELARASGLGRKPTLSAAPKSRAKKKTA